MLTQQIGCSLKSPLRDLHVWQTPWTIRIDRKALTASFTYWLLTTGWLLLTTRGAGALFPDFPGTSLFEMYKGMTFATVTAALLYILIFRQSVRFEREKMEREPAERALRESECRLREAEKLAHLGSSSWDARTDTTIWSEELFRIFGKDANQRPPTYTERQAIYTPESWARLDREIRRTLEAGESHDLRLKIVRPDGIIRDVHARGEASRDENGSIIGFHGTMQDITDWIRTDETLRLQASALRSAAHAIVIADSSGAILYANPAFTSLTGYTFDEAEGKSMRMLSSGKQDSDFYRTLWRTISSGKVWRGRLVNKRKDGSLYDEEETITPVRMGAGEISHFIAVKKDITEELRAAEALRDSITQLHELEARLERVREEERKAISHEVHDELGQVLTAIKMELQGVSASDNPGKVEYERKFQGAVRLLDDAMSTVRNIAGKLRPGVLDYLGLCAAIEWQMEEFERRSNIMCEVVVPEPAPVIDDGRSTVLFRILQEAITNTARHAEASCVKVRLTELDDEYEMTIADDGIGISSDQVNSPRSYGLLGIRERLHPFAGECVIRRPARGGTEMIIHLPKQIARTR